MTYSQLRFYLGRPYVHGHVGIRYRSDGHCVDCRRHRNTPERREVEKLRSRSARAERPYLMLLSEAKRRAKANGLPYDLTRQWAELRWTGHCEVSGIPFRRSPGKGGPSYYSPTIDRIDPKLGYVLGNCRFILNAINVFKGRQGDAEMLQVAAAIVERYHG